MQGRPEYGTFLDDLRFCSNNSHRLRLRPHGPHGCHIDITWRLRSINTRGRTHPPFSPLENHRGTERLDLTNLDDVKAWWDLRRCYALVTFVASDRSVRSTARSPDRSFL